MNGMNLIIIGTSIMHVMIIQAIIINFFYVQEEKRVFIKN